MIDHLRWPYIIVLLLITAGLVMDGITFAKLKTLEGKELAEYATTFIKFYKIVINIFFAVVFIWIIFNSKMLPVYLIIFGLLAVLLIADSVISLIIKMKYRVK